MRRPHAITGTKAASKRSRTDTPTLLPLAPSLKVNRIGAKGASVLAAILKETQITNLRCATSQNVCFCVTAPLDTAARLPSSLCPSPTVSVATTSESRAPPRSPPSSRRRRSTTSGAPSPHRVFAFVSAFADTHRMPLPLAVLTAGTRFRLTSSRAQSRLRRLTSRARGWALPLP